MTREALKKLNEKQMNYCKTLSALIDRAKIKGLKEENERNRGKLRGFLECMETTEKEIKARCAMQQSALWQSTAQAATLHALI